MRMNRNPQTVRLPRGLQRLQRGAMTMFTAIFVLVLITMMLLYAAKVGVFEQRISANDLRQKLAFHAAETGLDFSYEYLQNKMREGLLTSTETGDDPANVCDAAGFYAPGCVRWVDACPAELCSSPGIPPDSFIYDDDHLGSTVSYDTCIDATVTAGAGVPPLCRHEDFQGTLAEGTRFRTTAGICSYDGDLAWPPTNCLDLSVDTTPENVRHIVWMAAWGYSDCEDGGPLTDCKGQARMIRILGDRNILAGGGFVPLVSKNNFPPSGTTEVVPNPDAGGEGVPVSIWGNRNMAECAPLNTDEVAQDPLTVEGSFRTCEMHEWYGVDIRPDDAKCSLPTCKCDYPGPEPLSYRHAGETYLDIDVLLDGGFPCDLFKYYFGVPSSEYQTVKDGAKVINDCGNTVLNEESRGFYWFSGDLCDIDGGKSSKQVGSIDHPVILISAAKSRTNLGSNTHFYGILYISDVESPSPQPDFKPGGGATVYGAVIIDVIFPPSGFSGTFRVVYNDQVLGNLGKIGMLAGTYWRDFDLPLIDSANSTLSWAR